MNKMKIDIRHIGWWLCSMIVLLCPSCSSGSDDDDNKPDGNGPSMLEIHVYTPENPLVTRAEVNPESEEMKAVKTLDIWVFQSSTGTLVGHLAPQVSESFEGGTYQMSVSDDFAENTPDVDVFVILNAASAGFDPNTVTSRAQLVDAMIKDPYFGLTSPQATLPAAGLPMTGVLKNQTLEVSPPVLKVAPVKVVRAVSKVRFVFSRTDTGENQVLKINSISINDGMIPTQEYLFLDGAYHPETSRIKIVPDEYVTGGVLTPLTDNDQIRVCAYPAQYAYDALNPQQAKGQDYEDLIDGGIEARELTQVGRFYLRESDQKIKGEIKYTIGTGAEKTATFLMENEYDFSRNHTWIVYGYFAGKESLKVSCIDVTPWVNSESDREWYNW